MVFSTKILMGLNALNDIFVCLNLAKTTNKVEDKYVKKLKINLVLNKQQIILKTFCFKSNK